MNNYEVLGKIGEGSFGQVFKIKHQVTGKIAAQKVISKVSCNKFILNLYFILHFYYLKYNFTFQLGRSPKELDSLRQECKIQCRLNHLNIIQMIDSFETTDKVNI